jgi:hypothetical protein
MGEGFPCIAFKITGILPLKHEKNSSKLPAITRHRSEHVNHKVFKMFCFHASIDRHTHVISLRKKNKKFFGEHQTDLHLVCYRCCRRLPVVICHESPRRKSRDTHACILISSPPPRSWRLSVLNLQLLSVGYCLSRNI